MSQGALDQIDVPGETGDYIAVRATIGPGRELRIGGLRLAWSDGALVVTRPRRRRGIGAVRLGWRDGVLAMTWPGGLSITVGAKDARGETADVVVLTRADGPAVELIDSGSRGERRDVAVGAGQISNLSRSCDSDPAPLIRLGPGGDYVQDITAEDL